MRGEGGGGMAVMCYEGLSPILFSLLVQEITNEIHRYGIRLVPDLAEIGILLFAEDIVLIADSVFELQKKFDIVYEVGYSPGALVGLWSWKKCRKLNFHGCFSYVFWLKTHKIPSDPGCAKCVGVKNPRWPAFRKFRRM